MIINKFIDGKDKPITILSAVEPRRMDRTMKQVINPFFDIDCAARASVSYWAISTDERETGQTCVGEEYNKAMLACNSDIIVYSTGDNIIPNRLFWKSYVCLLTFHTLIFALRMDQQEDESLEENQNAVGDFIMVKRDWAIDIGGWDQRMKTWGVADYSFIIRMKRYIKKNPLMLGEDVQDKVIHLWHPRRDDAWYRSQNEINQKIFLEQPTWTKEMMLESLPK